MAFQGAEYYTSIINRHTEDDAATEQTWKAADGKEYTSEEAANDASRRYHMANPDPMTPEEQALYTMPLEKLKELGNRVAAGPEVAANRKMTQGAADAFVKWAAKLGYKDTPHNARQILLQLKNMGFTEGHATIANFEEAFHICNAGGVLTIDQAAIDAEAAQEADRQAAAYQQQRDEFVDTDSLSLNEIAARAGRNIDPYKF
jgi:hypothetical protein